jgi:site-specific recombinase XerD
MAKIPTVVIFTRHASDCRWFGDESRGSCGCPKFFRYSQDRKQVRRATGTGDLARALKLAADLQKKFEAQAEGKVWEGTEELPSLEQALAKFLEGKRKRGDLNIGYISRLDRELNRFVAWALQRNLVMLADIKPAYAMDYRNGLKGTLNTRAKEIRRIGEFFRYCVAMGWIRTDPMESAKLKYDPVQKARALNEDQFAKLLAAVARVKKLTDDQRKKLRALILLMRWTGLALVDAVSISRDELRVNGGGFGYLILRREKTGKPVEAAIKPEIVQEILAAANGGKYLFVNSWREKDDDKGSSAAVRLQSERERANVKAWWSKRMNDAAELADLRDENGAPYDFGTHSLRHTFAVYFLTKGLPLTHVAKLLGDNESTVERHYAEWIKMRADDLLSRMKSILKK